MRKTTLIKLSLYVSFLFPFLTANGQQWGKYTLYATMNGTTALLLDTTNAVYHTWSFSGSAQTGYSSYLLPNRELLRTVKVAGASFSGGPICGKVQKVDWNGNLLWDFTYSTTAYCTHHDIHPMPNGNVLLIAYESKTPAEVTAAGSTTSITMWPDKIVEVQPTGATTGTVVWEWHAWDHLVQNVDSLKANYQSSIVAHPELLNINYNTQKDWMHMNGVDYNDSLDQIAFSCHNLNEIYVIDHSTSTAEAASHAGGNSGKGGDILYRWGNPAAYQASGTQILKVVHDAHWIRRDCPDCPDANYLVGFNNNGISMSQSAVDQVDPPYSGYNYSITPGNAFLPASYTNRHSCTGHSSNMGNSQQMPNGNTLVCIATSGYVYEFDASGNSIWQYSGSGACPKAWRYTECYVDGATSAATVSESGDTLYSTYGATYQWYLDSVLIPGATSSFYVPSQDGNYQVVITSDEGCTSPYSSPYTYTGGAAIEDNLLSAGIILYPNPTTGVLNIQDKAGLNGNYSVSISDISGKVLSLTNGSSNVDLSQFREGIYFVTIASDTYGSVTKKVSVIR